MFRTIVGSSKSSTIPRSAKTALVVGLFVTVVASFLDKGIAHFVNPAFRPGSNSTRILVISPQLASNTIRKTFAGWSFVVPKDGDITKVMEKALTSSLAIPDAKSDRFYTPVTADYTIQCSDFNLNFQEFHLTHDGCADLSPDLRSNYSGGATIGMRTAYEPYDRWRIVTTSKSESYNTRVAALSLPFVTRGKSTCSAFESTRLRPYEDIEDGISSFPTTSTSRCIDSTGDVAVVSLTSTRFTFSNKEYNTDLTSKIFADPSDDLLQAMDETFKTKIIPPEPGTPSNSSVELWLEVRAMKYER
jgi:hypothetical protein